MPFSDNRHPENQVLKTSRSNGPRLDAGQAVRVTNSSSQAGSVSPSTTRSVLFERTPDGPGSLSGPQGSAAGLVGKGPSAAISAQEPQDAALGDPATSPPRAISEYQIALWVKRGEEFAAAGDFVSARLMFQRAAETGNAKAAFLLAETYDPAVLDTIRARGVAPNIAKARLWYEKAKNLGSPEAVRKLEVPKAAANAADASLKDAHASSSVGAGGSKEIDTRSGGSPAVLQSPTQSTPQKSEPVWPNPSGAVSAAKSDGRPAQAPEMAPPVSIRSSQGTDQVREPTRSIEPASPRETSRKNPRMIGRGYRDRSALLDRFPAYSQWIMDRGMPRRHGRRQNYSTPRLFGN